MIPPNEFTCPFRSYEAALYFSNSEFTVHNNITLKYYGQVNSLRLK